MISEPSTSHFSAIDSIVPGPVEPGPFAPGEYNVSPKFLNGLTTNAWEAWLFDGVSEKDHSAFMVGMRRSDKNTLGGCKVQVLARWPDQTSWHRDFLFSDSIVSDRVQTRGVSGVWRDTPDGPSISFQISEDCSQLSLTFDVPGTVVGSVVLSAEVGDTGLETSDSLGPLCHYMRPIARASVTADMLFDGERPFVMHPDGQHRVHGGFDRYWALHTWAQILSESTFLRGQAGPYAIQVLQILSDASSGRKAHVSGRLYRDGKLLCASQRLGEPGAMKDSVAEDTVTLTKTYDGTGLVGKWREKSDGYTLDFQAGGNKRWHFEVKHAGVMWTFPTCAPRADTIGNTGWVETLRGGAAGETFSGSGCGGHQELELPRS